MADPTESSDVTPAVSGKATTDTEKYVFRGVRVFDGKDDRVSGPRDVYVRDKMVCGIVEPNTPSPDTSVADSEWEVIEGGGNRVLMPGLIDAHWHAAYTAVTPADLLGLEPGYFNAIMTKQAERTLMRGFTTVRDLSGPVIGLKRAIDKGLVLGPRFYPCGAALSQTGGHGDFRMLTELPRDGASPLSYGERLGGTVLADGVPEVLRGVREQFMHGASQIKVMAGGGVASDYDPLDVTQYTPEEMRAAVQAAENWNTYVTVHAYTDRTVRQAIEAGVRCIEHGHLIKDDDTVELFTKHDVWWSLQPFVDEFVPLFEKGSSNAEKLKQILEGTDIAYNLAIKHGVKVAWGTDILFSADLAEKQGAMLRKTTDWFSSGEALRIATGGNGDLLKMSMLRDPYPEGKLGVIETGAHADLLLVDGDPVANIDLITTPDTSLVVIMKGGSIVKNILPQPQPR